MTSSLQRSSSFLIFNAQDIEASGVLALPSKKKGQRELSRRKEARKITDGLA